jgi:2'-5' RNA ligase
MVKPMYNDDAGDDSTARVDRQVSDYDSAYVNPGHIGELRTAATAVLGIVIEVPAPWGEDLQQWRTGFGDNSADHMPTHVTLVAPVRIPTNRLDVVLAAVDDVCATTSSFHIQLSGIETFRPTSPVVYLAVQSGAPECTVVHTRLRAAVTDEPALHPFVPHTTIAMQMPNAVLDAAAAALADYTASWQAEEVSSFLRGADGRWTRLMRHEMGTAI